MKLCGKCQTTKPLDDFYVLRKKGRTYRQSWCKPCLRETNQQWKKANPDAVKAADRRKVLKKRYGITTSDYNKLLSEQNGGCGVCGKPERTIQRAGSPVQFMAVDHDHDTGRLRGLLCQSCNRTLGNMGDNLEGVMRFVAYLERSVGKRPIQHRR